MWMSHALVHTRTPSHALLCLSPSLLVSIECWMFVFLWESNITKRLSCLCVCVGVCLSVNADMYRACFYPGFRKKKKCSSKTLANTSVYCCVSHSQITADVSVNDIYIFSVTESPHNYVFHPSLICFVVPDKG